MFEYTFKLSKTTSINLYIIRVVASQVVAIGHILDYIFIAHSKDITYFAGPSVPIFFFISGFLIAHSIFTNMENKKYKFTQFLMKRFSRIYPLFLLVPLPWFIFLTLFFNAKLIFTVDFVYTLSLYIFLLHPSMWTLNLFWWNYMLFGWLILGRRTVKTKLSYVIILVLIGILTFIAYYGCNIFFCTNIGLIWMLGVVFCVLLNQVNQEKKYESRYRTHLLDFRIILILIIFLGLLLWHIDWFYGGNIVIFFSLILYGILLGFHICSNNLYQMVFLIPILLFGIMLLIYIQQKKYEYSLRFEKFVKFMANYSFSLFLIHPIIYIIAYFLGAYNFTGILLFITFYISANVISILISFVIERQAPKIHNYLLRRMELKN
ncbi:MAG: membrane protein of unknown function [Promethearchaeota archaeon]|nr:MAG: membrane protein of unknown function [Candidatus Lokiarchaeota archaeon]